MGWRNESYRHSLAARGVKTNRYLAIKWRPEFDVPVFDSPDSFAHKVKKDVVWMKPDDFLDSAGRSGLREGHVARLRKGSVDEEGDFEFDTPFLEYDSEGNIINHEGRHRVRLAQQDGAVEVPVGLIEDEGLMSDSEKEAFIRSRLEAKGRRYNSVKDDVRFDELHQILDELLIEETGINMRFDVLRANKSPSRDEMLSGMDEFARLGLRRQQIVEERLAVESELASLNRDAEE